MERLGPYEIVDEVGQGGMAVVYRARDTTSERDVALKVILDERADDAHQRRRLLREAEAASAIDHPAVCEVYDVSEDEGRVYIAMELLQGETLRARLDDGPLDPLEALEHARALADVIAAAHALGVVHRDIKPDNVMLTDGGLKLLDFGIARQMEQHIPVSEAETALTREGAVVGTPGYMAPEQMLGMHVDERSDLFAIGVTLYAMLTGRLPFDGHTLIEIAVSVVRDTPAPLSAHFGAAWPDLEHTVAMCLAKDPNDRIPSAVALRDRLDAHLEQWRVGPPSPSLPPTERAPSTARRWWVAGGVAAVLVLGIWFGTRDPTTTPDPSVGSATASPSVVTLTDLPMPQTNEQARVAFGRALAAFRDGSWGRAQSELELALKHDPNLPAAHLRLALFHGASGAGNPKRARDAYQRAASMRAGLTPRDQDLLHALEPMLAHTPPDVKATHDRLVTVAAARPTDAELTFLAAWTALVSGRRDDALRLARGATALDPSYADPWQVVANVLVARGDFASAEEPLRKCAALSPASADCLADLTEVKARLGDCAATLEIARQFAGRVSDHAGHRTLAWALAGHGAEPAAVDAALRRAAEDDVGDPQRIAVHEVRSAIWAGDLRRAIARSEDALGLAETSEDLGRYARPALLRVQLLEEVGRLPDASKAAKAFIDRAAALADAPLAKPADDPTMEMWRIRAAAGDASAEDLDAALTAWRGRWQERSSDATSVWLNGPLRMAHDKRGARLGIARAPDPPSWHQAFRHPESLAILGRAQWLAGELDAAVSTLEAAAADCRLLRAPVDLMRTRLLLGRALQEQGAQEEACGVYQSIIDRWSASPESRTRQQAVARSRSACGR